MQKIDRLLFMIGLCIDNYHTAVDLVYDHWAIYWILIYYHRGL